MAFVLKNLPHMLGKCERTESGHRMSTRKLHKGIVEGQGNLECFPRFMNVMKFYVTLLVF